MSVFINLPTNTVEVDGEISAVSKNPVQNKVIVDTIKKLFNQINYNIVDGGTMSDQQYSVASEKKPITLNNKIYYCSGEDSNNFYYFTNYVYNNSVVVNLASISKSTKKVTYIEGATNKEQIYFSTYLEFPNIGQENILYVDKSDNTSYLWNESKQIYEGVKIASSDDYAIQSIL